MGVTSGLCGVDEFHDDVSGLCGHCSDICRNIAKPDDFCIYHCSDYHRRLLPTTAISLQEKPITLVLIPVLVLLIISMMVIIIVITFWCRYLKTHIRTRKQYKSSGHRNTERELTVARFRQRHRVNRHNSVQETRDPNKQEDMELSVLCISPCSSLVLGPESETERLRFHSSAHGLSIVYLNRVGSKHNIKTDAIVSVEAMPSYSEFDETQLKIACDTESRSSTFNNKGSGELVKKLSDFEINSTHSKLVGTKHFDTAHDSSLYFVHSEGDNSETSNTPVQEICTYRSPKGVHSEHGDESLHTSIQESYRPSPNDEVTNHKVGGT